MINTAYQQRAFEIIKSSIKSAVFIDENARLFFQNEKDLTGKIEEQISIDLFNNFKESGVSLDIHKYAINDENRKELKDYLFDDRDLVLLDWHLDGQGGEEFSLKLLEDIVHRPHIHFCAIYTSDSEEQLNLIFRNILSYFSGETQEYYDNKKMLLEDIDGIESIKDQLNFISVNRDSKEAMKAIGILNKTSRDVIKDIKSSFKNMSSKGALINASIALDNTWKSIKANNCPDMVSFESKTIVIKNTIITILNKDDNKPIELLKRLADQVINQESSFTQLLGLEMRSILSKHSSFIDSNLLKVTEKAFIHHYNNYVKEGFEHFFPEFVKNVFLEKINLNLRNQNLSLLEADLLNSFDHKSEVDDSELIAMNTFYNATRLKSDNKVSFGDVFVSDSGSDYFICITALCDCLRHEEKVENKFFFAKGTNISKKDALELGDSAFISYLDNSPRIVKWTEVVSNMLDDHHKYSPVYIKPVQFTIVNPSFDDDKKIVLHSLNKTGELQKVEVQYITTIKQNYTQRIANHAFGHPVRVGVDFVKKS